MSYDTAREALSKNLAVILEGKNITPQDYLIYDLGRSLSHLIDAVQADLAEIKGKLDRLGGAPPPPR
jgi:hypothetical protein